MSIRVFLRDRVAMLTSALVTVVLTAGLAACSTTPDQPQTAASTQSDQVCTMEKPLGSNIPKRVCRSRAQVEAEQSSAASTYREAIRSTAPISNM